MYGGLCAFGGRFSGPGAHPSLTLGHLSHGTNVTGAGLGYSIWDRIYLLSSAQHPLEVCGVTTVVGIVVLRVLSLVFLALSLFMCYRLQSLDAVPHLLPVTA